MQIFVYNKSTVVTTTDVALMVSACNILLQKFCFIWNILPVTVTHLIKLQNVNYIFYIIDNTTVTPTIPTCGTAKIGGYIMAKTILNNGGAVLWKDNNTYTVAADLFHQIAQTIIDPTINVWWRLDSIYMVASDVCNPVMNNLVVMQVPNPALYPNSIYNTEPIIKEIPLSDTNNVKVALCDFIYPSWFDPSTSSSTGIIYNYTNTLTKPFSISTTGYVILLNTKTNTLLYYYGSSFPTWEKALVNQYYRNVIRNNYIKNFVSNGVLLLHKHLPNILNY